MTEIAREGGPAARIRVLEHGAEAWPTRAELLARHRVDGIIRIRGEELEAIPAGQRQLAHFNLERSFHRPGLLYAVAKIVEPGFFRQGGEERLPLLDFSTCRRARCVAVEESLPYAALQARHFVDSMPHIRDGEALRHAILARYGQSLPELAPEEIERRGVAYTLLAFED